ncbi:hypothetical protein chiPu_0025787, partial [Chiloscyllium punctatum]|nr:hypothetical protein [Chiloscyllium punctatum]
MGQATPSTSTLYRFCSPAGVCCAGARSRGFGWWGCAGEGTKTFRLGRGWGRLRISDVPLPALTDADGLISFLPPPTPGVAATSIFTSGKYAIDPELRGSEFERLTQNLDVHFWKSFWNITETELLA